MGAPHGSRRSVMFDSEALSRGNAAPLAVTALAIDPENEQIVYAATNIWLGTSTVHLTPLGVAVSVDGGRQWLQLSTALPSDAPVWHLEPVAGQPLSVVTVNNTGSHTVSLKMSPELLGLLQDGDPAVRASAARAIELIGGLISDPGPAAEPTAGDSSRRANEFTGDAGPGVRRHRVERLTAEQRWGRLVAAGPERGSFAGQRGAARRDCGRY